MIRTVCKDIPSEEFGFCDTHSHVFMACEHLLKNYDDFVFACDNYEQICEELDLYRKAGGSSLVDAQPIGTGRRALMLRQASEKTGVHIVASTGSHQQCFYPEGHWIFRYSEEELAKIYIREINEGMYDYCESREPEFRTDVRAGQIKIATQSTILDEHHKKLVRAAAAASNETGAPIMIHTENKSAAVTVEMLMELGVPAWKIILAHTDRYHNDPPASFDVGASYGVWMAVDTFSSIDYDQAAKVQVVKDQIELGRAKYLLLGLDPTRPLFTVFNGRLGFGYLPGSFTRAMKEAGISDEDIKSITVDNPACAWDMQSRERAG